jgi:hypothetical protein
LSSSSIGRLPVSTSIFADPLNVGQLARRIGDDRSDRVGQIANRPRSVAIRPHAEGVGVLEFENVADQVEGVSDLGVRHDGER